MIAKIGYYVPRSALVKAIEEASQDLGLRAIVFGPHSSHENVTLVQSTVIFILKPWTIFGYEVPSWLQPEYASVTIENGPPTNWFHFFPSDFSDQKCNWFINRVSEYAKSATKTGV